MRVVPMTWRLAGAMPSGLRSACRSSWPCGGELGLKLRIGGSKLYVTISNQGNTIPPEELPLVFDRFHKIDKARNRSQEGWGLGLYIVKTLVCSHGENISVASRDGRTEFTFTMPLVN
jgi:signal transduction histidine kinase